MKPSLKSIFFGEGIVSQEDADNRPLHGAPVYFYPTGRSMLEPHADQGAFKNAVKWNEDHGLLDVKELVKRQQKKKRWYDKGLKNENTKMAQERFKLSLEVLRSDSPRSPEDNEELSRKVCARKRSSERRKRVRINSERIDWLRKEWGEIRDTFKEYYPHDPAINNSGAKKGIEGRFYTMNQVFYYGTNQDLAVGDYISQENTNNINNFNSQINTDKIYFVTNKQIAKAQAEEVAKQHGTGAPNVYAVMPIGEIEWDDKGKSRTTLSAPTARIIRKVY